MFWLTRNLVNVALGALALIGVLYVVTLARPATPQFSGWRGGPQAPVAAIAGAAVIAGAAAPQGGLNPDAVANPSIPTGNPLRARNTVMTQGYGTGSHAPAEIWGGVDLALDGNGDGQADPQGSLDAPVYATHAGTVAAKADTWPGGNCILLQGDGYRTTYCHLNRFAVADGAQVQRGDLIAYVGSTGNSSGPHLHYEVWVGGTNRSPLDFGALDGTGR